ncbi:hypothetical protein MTO96_016272 [Rhipicephalus appendiculatus]
MESPRSKAFCGSVEKYFFSSWPRKDRLVLRSLYDRYVATWVILIRENEAAGGRRRDDCSQWSLWNWLACKLRSSCNRSVQAKEVENFFKKVICGVARPDEVPGLLDFFLLQEHPSLSASDATDDASGRSEDDSRSELEWGLMKVDAPQPQTPGSNASDPKEQDKEQATDARRVDGVTDPNELHSLSERCQRESEGTVDAVPASTPSDCKVLAAGDQIDAASEYPKDNTADGVSGEAVTGEISIAGSDSVDDDAALAISLTPIRDVEDAGGLEHKDDAAVCLSVDAIGFQVPEVGATITLTSTDCWPDDIEADNSFICGLPYGDLCSVEYRTEENCTGDCVDEDACESPCESPCSVSDRCDGQAQCTPDSFDREVQCDIDSDFLSELMEIEDALQLEVSRLHKQLLDMQEAME